MRSKVLEILAGQSQVVRERDGQRADDEDAIHHKNETRQSQAGDKTGDGQPARDGWAWNRSRLTADRDVRTIALDAQFAKIEDQRDHEQNGADRRRANEIAKTFDQRVGLGR